ncbi:hypothetical protein [Nitrincola sp. MINF-07-Sa-05]|uniref:hypothetical protein n=1 Tax=Nitrincola salilacus TaxID=3400273 RepID=UPI003917D28B
MHPGARLSALYDPLNRFIHDLQIAPCSTGERELAAAHLQAASPGDLILYDRGYPADDFADLYLLRWFTEETYATCKSRLETENLTGYSPRTKDIREP